MQDTAAVVAVKAPSPADTVANLRAFAKLYGYVRFFHPSDEASSIDWDRFAILGAGRVAGCADAKALRTTLAGLFSPLAPSLRVCGAGVKPRPVKLPGDSATCLPVCWQHHGVGLTGFIPYHSERTNRPKTIARFLRSVTQDTVLPPGESAGKRTLRVRARVRAENVRPGLEPELVAVGFGPDEYGFMALPRCSAGPVTGSEWHVCQIEVALEPGQTKALVGVTNAIGSTLWADDFEAWASSGDSWVKLELADPGFEDTGSLAESPAWFTYLTDAEKTQERPFAGARCMVVKPAAGESAFAGSPVPGDYVDKPLDRGLSCRVPLCLWSKDEHTLPRADGASLGRLKSEVAAVSLDTAADPSLELRLGDVIIAWTVLEHFYPYFDVVPVDWDKVLTTTLSAALDASNRSTFLRALRHMSAALHDGHAVVRDLRSEWGFVPAWLEVVEGRIVVVAAADSSGLRCGDVLVSVNGRPAEEAFEEQRSLSSGSPQFRRARGAIRLLAGPIGHAINYRVERGADAVDVSALPDRMPLGWPWPGSGSSIRELEKDIWYVDLNRAPMPAIDSVMDKLAKARGVVFDLRSYPKGNHEVICHLLTGKEQRGEKWMWIPRIAWPDHERVAGWDGTGWDFLQPTEPHIAGKVVFLTSGSAGSYAESFMSYIEGFKLAEIVGGPTGGFNGDINPINLPGGYSFSWTGMKVTKFDGSQHHLIGIQPTVPLERTLKAVREGRDEYIEKALELICGSTAGVKRS